MLAITVYRGVYLEGAEPARTRLPKLSRGLANADFKAKCTKFNFGWGFAPEPAGGAYSAP